MGRPSGRVLQPTALSAQHPAWLARIRHPRRRGVFHPEKRSQHRHRHRPNARKTPRAARANPQRFANARQPNPQRYAERQRPQHGRHHHLPHAAQSHYGARHPVPRRRARLHRQYGAAQPNQYLL